MAAYIHTYIQLRRVIFDGRAGHFRWPRAGHFRWPRRSFSMAAPVAAMAAPVAAIATHLCPYEAQYEGVFGVTLARLACDFLLTNHGVQCVRSF